jgi:ABC-type lipoprotein release transport system permease subunit
LARWIEKQRNILDFTLSAVLRRKGKNISLLLVYILVVFVLASALFFTQAIKREASLLLQGAPELVIQRLLQGRYDPIPVSYLKEIRKIPGVLAVHWRLWGYYYDPAVGANYTLMVPRHDAMPPEKITIGSGIARTRQIDRGDTISLKAFNGDFRTFEIRNVIEPNSELLTADLVLLGESDFRDLFGLSPNYATDLAVTVRNPNEVTTVARKITELFSDTRVILREEMVRTYDSVFDWRGGIILVLSVMALLSFIILAWEKASGLSAEERREIGILKATGWETSEVLAVKTYEGLLLSFLSFACGILLAYGHVFFSSAFLFAPALKGWSVLYPEFRLTPSVDPSQLAILFFLTIGPYTVATLVPSWRAAIIDPDTVMRT